MKEITEEEAQPVHPERHQGIPEHLHLEMGAFGGPDDVQSPKDGDAQEETEPCPSPGGQDHQESPDKEG